MAVEAVSQLHHETNNAPEIAGFSFRSIAIKSTLLVPDDELGVETILNMQPANTKMSKSSMTWFEFYVSSVLPSTDDWTEHCSGLIRVETTRKGVVFPLDYTLPWYPQSFRALIDLE